MESEQLELRFDQWCLLEIMGHQRYAGRVTEQTIGGQAFLRIDIPAAGPQPPFTKFFSAGSVYAITPTTEELARGIAAELQHAPIGIYDLPAEMQEKLRAPRRQPALFDGQDDDDNDPDCF